MPYTLATLIQYVKALDLPEHSGLPSNGYFIYSHENEIRRIQVNEIVSQIIQANFEVIDQQTVFPSSGYRRYRVLTPDTYQLNDQSITVTQEEIDNNWVFIVVDDGVSHKELEPKPDNGSIIKDWSSSETDLEFPSVRLFNGKVYRVIQGEESGSEEPNDSDNWELLIENTINLRQVTNNLRIRIGDLGDLDTDNTDNIVDAINEVLELINSINFDIPDLEHENTDTVELSGGGTSTEPLEANLIISPDNDNVIKEKSNGVYVRNSKIEWDNEEKIIAFKDNEGDIVTINLSEFAQDFRVSGGEYDRDTYVLTLEVEDGEGGTETVSIDLKKLAEISHTNTATIELQGKGVTDNKLRANLIISDSSGNLLEAKNDGAYVSNKMSNLDNDAGYAKTSDIDYPVTSVNGRTGDVVIDKEDVDLENVDNVKQATKTEFDAHANDSDIHVTSSEKSTWNNKAEKSDIKDGKFKVKGVGALQGEGETSANADDDTDAELDLTQDTKDNIQKGIDAYEYDLQKITENGRSTSKYLIIDRESEKRYINYTIRGKGVSTPIVISLGIADNENERWYARGTISGSRAIGSDVTSSNIIDFSSSWTRLPEIFSIAQNAILQFKSVKFEFEGEIYYGIVVGEITSSHYPTFWTFDVNIRNDYDDEFQITILELSEVDIIDENDKNINVKINNQLISTQAWVESKGYLTNHQDISGKQDKLTEGSNISINGNTISATDTTYSEISKSEAENKNSSTKRLISGRRLFDSFSKNITDWWNNLSISISKISGLQSALDNKANNSVKVEGTGSLTGGGNLTANRTIDLTSTTKSDIAKGVTAHGWGDFRDYGLGRTNRVDDFDDFYSFPEGESFWYSNFTALNFPNDLKRYGTLQNYRTVGSGYQIYKRYDNDDKILYRRYRDETWGDWKTIADTGYVESLINDINLPSAGTLTHLENGTDTEQRTYRPKDIHDFVRENKSLREKVVYFDKSVIDEMLSLGTGYTVIPAPASNEFIHVESLTITPKTGGEFPPVISGAIMIRNILQMSFKAQLDKDTKSENMINTGLRASERGEPCEIFFDSVLDTTDYVGQIKFTIRYRIINND